MNHQSTESLQSPAVDAFQQAVAGSFAPTIWATHTVLVAVSGGPDSVALIRAIKFLKDRSPHSTGEVVVGHVQHGLRGLESDQDQRFVESLAGDHATSKEFSLTARINQPQEQFPCAQDPVDRTTSPCRTIHRRTNQCIWQRECRR